MIKPDHLKTDGPREIRLLIRNQPPPERGPDDEIHLRKKYNFLLSLQKVDFLCVQV